MLITKEPYKADVMNSDEEAECECKTDVTWEAAQDE